MPLSGPYQSYEVPISVGTTAELVGAPITFPTGTRVYNLQTQSEWIWLDASVAPAPNGSTVLASSSGNGAWLQSTQNPSVMSQLNWFVDPVNGNDANDGKTAATALQTDAQRQLRMGSSPTWANGTYHLFYLNDLPTTDPVILRGLRMPSAAIFLHGSATAGNGQVTLFSGTIDVLVARNRSSIPQRSWEPTSNAIPVTWAASGLIGSRIRLTSGANIGATSWPILDLGAKAVKCCNYMTKLGIAPNTAIPIAEITPAVTDQFVVEQLTKIPNCLLEIVAFENGTFNTSAQVGVFLDSLDFANVVQGNLQNRPRDRVAYYGCIVRCEGANKGNATLTADGLFFISCRCTGTSQFLIPSRNVTAFYGGYADILVTFDSGALAEFNRDFMVQGNRITATSIGGQATVNALAVFNGAGPGVRFDGVFRMVVNGPLWGDGNTGVGLAIGSNEVHMAAGFVLTNLTITGAGGDFSLGGVTAVRAFDDTVPGWTAARATTWALLNTTIGGGGFGGQVIHQPSGGRVVQNFSA